MATNVALSSNSVPTLPAQQEGGRNLKQSRRSEEISTVLKPSPPTGDLDSLARRLDALTTFGSFLLAKSGRSLDVENFAGICEKCKAVMSVAKDYVEMGGYPFVDWSEASVNELEEILFSNLETFFRSIIKFIASCGYSEDAVIDAVFSRATSCGTQSCGVSNIVDDTIAMLMSGKEVSDPSPNIDLDVDLRHLAEKLLADMLGLLRKAWPFFSMGDALWCMLVCNMDLSAACAFSADTSAVSDMDSYFAGVTSQLTTLGSNISRHKRLSSTPASASASNSSNSFSNVHNIANSVKSTRTSVSVSSVVMESSASSTMTHQEAKTVCSGQAHVGDCKRESSVKLKSVQLVGSRGPMKLSKPGGLDYLSLERKLKASSDSTNINFKGLSRSGKSFKISASQAELIRNIYNTSGVYSSCDQVSSSPVSGKTSKNTVQSPGYSTGPLPPSSSSSAFHNRKQDLGAPAGCSHDFCLPEEICNDCISKDKKDELTHKLFCHMDDLESLMQDWSEWAQQKVTQASYRLVKDKSELQSLREYKTNHYQGAAVYVEESTRKRLEEMAIEIRKASCDVDSANAAIKKLEAENTWLRLEMETAKLQAAESEVKHMDLSAKEMETLKVIQSWDKQKASLQDVLTCEKNKLSQLQQKLEEAKRCHQKLEAKCGQEEKMSKEALARMKFEQNEHEQILISAKSQENSLRLKAENDYQRYKIDLQELEMKISELILHADQSNIQSQTWNNGQTGAPWVTDCGQKTSAQLLIERMALLELASDVKPDRECVMCLTDEMSVVFLPCAHQVLCSKCNDIHEKQGMKDCPSCRTPILRRISVRFADS